MNKLIILIGPSGSGKDTVRIKLEKKLGLTNLISTTTRDPRTGEKNGIHYHFISEKIFQEGIDKNLFLEYSKFNNKYYGKHKDDVNKLIKLNKDIITILEINGLKNILKQKELFEKQNYKLITIFLDISKGEIKHRMLKRGDKIELIEERLKNNDHNYFIEGKEIVDYVINANNTERQVLSDIIQIIKKN